MSSPRVVRLNLQKYAEKGLEALRLKAIDVCLEIAEGVKDKTPVDTGFCRAMWSAQINDRPQMQPVLGPTAEQTAAATPKAKKGKKGQPAEAPKANFGAMEATAIASISAEAMKLQLGDVVWIYNPTVYAPALENGHSKQAPNGMVSLTVAEIKAKYT